MARAATAATLALRAGEAAPSTLTILSARCTLSLLTVLRARETAHEPFVAAADRLARVVVEEALACLPSTRVRVNTPCGTAEGVRQPPADKIALVSILRAGDALLRAAMDVCPEAHVGKVLIQRDEASPDKRPVMYFAKLPVDIAERYVVLLDPMLATGGSAAMAIKELVARGVPEDHIVFANIVACPEGIARVSSEFPRVHIVTAAVDERLNEHKYIVPGLGDFGDRYFGTVA